MTDTNQKQRPYYFNLKADGDSAVVRLLHSSTKTIEQGIVHRVKVGDSTRTVKCIAAAGRCPLCEKGIPADTRIYIHLWDYTDNKEKVWDRTDKIIPQLESLEIDWNPLNSAVVKITRKGNEFPKYDVVTVNPANYSNVDSSLIDEPVGKMFSMSKKLEEIETYLKTGEFPAKTYLPKEEYEKLTQEQKEKFKSTGIVEKSNVSNPQDTTPIIDDNSIPNRPAF